MHTRVKTEASQKPIADDLAPRLALRQQRFSFHRSLTYSLTRTLTYTMAGIPIPRGYNTGSGGPTNNHSRRLGGTTTTISSSGGAGVGGSIVDASTPTNHHNMEQSLVQQPKVEPRRHRPAPPSYLPTTQLQQQPEPPPPQQQMPYGVSTSSLPATPRSEEQQSSWSSGPQHHEWNISNNNSISNFKSNSNDNEGMGTKSCLTFSKQGLGNHTNKHTATTRFGRGGTTTSTTTSNHSSVASSSANSSGRRSKARSFLSLRRGSSGIISATASNNSSRRGAASSQSSQASSNNNNYNKNAAAWSISQPPQPPLTTNYVSDDEYFSENAESWLLKETSNYTPWSVGSAYGEKPTTTTIATTDRKTAIVSPETIRDTTTASTTSLPSVEHLLTFPPVEDRSDRKRIEYEQRLRNSATNNTTPSNPRRRGLYEGELEPEGVRGQEARVVTPSSTSTATTQQLLPSVSSKDSNFQIIKPVTVPAARKSLTQPVLVDIPEESYDSSSVSNDAATAAGNSKTIDFVKPPPPKTVTPSIASRSPRITTNLHQNRPSRLVPPPPSRVKSSRRYQIPEVEEEPNPRRRTVNDTTTNVPLVTRIKQEEEEEDAPTKRLTTEDVNLSNGDNDIPWVKSSQAMNASNLRTRPPIQSTRRMSSDSESTVGVSPYPASSRSTSRNTTAGLTTVKPESTTVEQLHTTASNAVRGGNFDVALTAFHTILQIQLERNGRSHAATAAAYHNLGTVYAKRASVVHTMEGDGDDDEAQRQSRTAALECFQAAARCARDASPDIEHPHPNVAVSLVRVGFLLLQSKQYQNAIVTFQEALRIRITHYGKLHALSANLYNNLGVCCLHMGEFEQGLYHLEQAMEIQRHLVTKSGRGSPKHQGNESAIAAHELELADTLFNIGGLCLEWMRRQGPDARRADEAEAAFLECLQLRTRVLGQAHPQTLQVKSLYGIAKSVPRPRRILKTTPSPMPAARRRDNSVDRIERMGNQNGDSIVQRSFDDYTEPSHVRRRNHNVASPVKIPPTSPIRPLSEVSSIANEDSNDAASIFRIGGSNNVSPQRPDAIPTGEAKPRNVPTSTMKPDKLDRISSRSKESEPPLLQITVSREEDETNHVGTKKDTLSSRGTHIFMAPHLVPESPSRRQTDDSGDAHISVTSYDKDNFTADTSSEMPRNASNTSVVLPQVSSYDTEENCIISDNGVDSEVGRIHYPLAWNRAGILQSNNPNDDTKATRRDIMVVQPIRQLQANSDKLQQSQGRSKIDASSTGNVERDDILARARAILTAHDPNNIGASSNEIDDENDETLPDNASHTLDQDLDDGIASLGGNWESATRSKTVNGKKKLTVREMLRDPISNLPEIHDEASRQLKSGNTVDAYRLFDVVLQCQRHLQGPLHPDVAAALHNVGIVQLRSQNHSEALKAFEEAARIRKGSLGKDHPLVAVR